MKTRNIFLGLGDSNTDGSDKATVRYPRWIMTYLPGDWYGVNGGVGGEATSQIAARFNNTYKDEFTNAATKVVAINASPNNFSSGTQAEANSAWSDIQTIVAAALLAGWKVILIQPAPCNAYSGWNANKQQWYYGDPASLHNLIGGYTLTGDVKRLNVYALLEDQAVANRLAQSGGVSGNTTINGITITRREYHTSVLGGSDGLHINNNAHQDVAQALYATMYGWVV
ncbi:MAG: hypothetical protein AB7E98_11975 [Pirellulales bacterium]